MISKKIVVETKDGKKIYLKNNLYMNKDLFKSYMAPTEKLIQKDIFEKITNFLVDERISISMIKSISFEDVKE